MTDQAGGLPSNFYLYDAQEDWDVSRQTAPANGRLLVSVSGPFVCSSAGKPVASGRHRMSD
jgi:hypothetical protein